MAGNVPDWLRTNHKKTGDAKVQNGVQSRPIFHSEHVDNPLAEEHEHTSAAFYSNGGRVRLADGGEPTEAQLKQMGIEASDRERATGNMSIMDRLKNTAQRFSEGNIDKPGSLAYERYGAGRGRQEYQNQQAFAENAKMQGDGMRNAGMVMSGRKSAEVEATKDISPTPSKEYSQDTEPMKSKAVRGDTSTFPTQSEDFRPMGDATTAKPVRRISPRPAPAAAPAAVPSPATSAQPVRGSAETTRSVVIPNNPRPPVDNETRASKPAKGGDNAERKSKPYPAEQAAQKLGLVFKDADNALKADPNNAAKKAERDRAYQAYLFAMKTMKR